MAWALRPPSSPVAGFRLRHRAFWFFLAYGMTPYFGAHSPRMNAASLKRNKWVRRGVLALLAVLGLWVLAWLAVPPIAKSQIQKIASEKLGRQVTVGKIDFKPWTLELTLSDLRIAKADGSQPQVAVARIYADAELQSILRLAPVIDAVTIESPAIVLTHEADGKYDIDDVLAKLAVAPDKPQGEPPGFAIHNIAITGGSFDFDDKAVKRKHVVRDFVLKVPLLSNLPSQREITTEPKLAFVLNGSAFDSAALSTPFAQSRKTDAQVSFKDLDLVPYLGYIPGGLPVALRAGKLDADLKIDFERAATAGLKITGRIAAHGIKLADARGADLLGFNSLEVALADVRPLERVVHLTQVTLAAPKGVVARDAAGRLNLLATNRTTGADQKATPPTASASSAQRAATQPGWRVQVDKLAITGGEIGWRDQTTQPAAAVDVKQFNIQASALAWPIEKPSPFSGSSVIDGAVLRFSGEATDKMANVRTEVESLPLSLAAPYLAQSLEPTLDGKLSGQIDVVWAQPDLRFKARRIVAEGLALTQAKTALASVGRFELVDAEADMTKHTLNIAAFTATNPKLRVERDDGKRWMFERWMKAPESGGQGNAAAASASAAAAKPWQLSLGTVAIDNGAVSYSDKAGPTPVEFEISALKLVAQKIAPGTGATSPIQLSGRLGAGRAEAGRFDYKGSLALKPISTQGRLEMASIPAHALKAYYAEALNIDIRRAFLNYSGSVSYAAAPAGMSLKLAGDTALDDFRANSVALTQSPGLDRSNQILRWKTLSLRGLQVNMLPGAPLAVDVRETTLTDFFARVIVDPTGRVNLQDLAKKPGAPPAADAAASVPAPAAATVAKAPPPERAGPAPIINFGPMSLVNGRIDFTDLFVKPNYSADLSELTGKLSAFSSSPQGNKPALADLELSGKAQQTAPLEITGKLNPLAKPLELDITAKMRELDLPPLSPYSVRYAGHGIERGKLSMDVTYKITPNGQLTATNKLVLNQLKFGDPVEGAPNSLPVRLAVALLADRNGVIDVDFPVSGSLNDPQFSIGPLIFKAIVNLIVKAAAAPFALLTGGLGGGSGESSAISFAPGSAVLSPAARESLDKVAKALMERPGLQITVAGTSSLERERDAYQRQRLRALTQSEKRRAAVRSNQDAADVTPVTDAEYPALLEAVYKRTEITKPRNMVGLAKDLPTNEMEDLLLAGIAVDEESMRQLAVERGAAVRDYLLAQKLPSERLFLGAVRTRATGADWKPGAELNLATR